MTMDAAFVPYFDLDDEEPLALEPLPSHAACASCGIRVAGPFTREDLEVVTTFGRRGHTADVDMTRCSICAQIHAAAVGLLDAHKSLRQSIGDPRVAEFRLACALNGLDALGINDPVLIDRLTASVTDLRRLLEHMTVPGNVARWAHGALSVTDWGTALRAGRPRRWEHLSDDQTSALREAYRSLYAERIERPVPILCISDDGRPAGCMMCGVAAWEALPSRMNYIWTEMSADPETIGGRGAADSVDGYVCPRCDWAIDRAEAVGSTAMGLSVLDFLGAQPMNDFEAARAIDGLLGWAVSGATPNAKPWQHVDLSGLQTP